MKNSKLQTQSTIGNNKSTKSPGNKKDLKNEYPKKKRTKAELRKIRREEKANAAERLYFLKFLMKYEQLIKTNDFYCAVDLAMNEKHIQMFGKNCMRLWFCKSTRDFDYRATDFLCFLLYSSVYYFLLGPFTNLIILRVHEESKIKYMARYLGFYGWNIKTVKQTLVWLTLGLGFLACSIFDLRKIPSLVLQTVFMTLFLRCLFVSVTYYSFDLKYVGSATKRQVQFTGVKARYEKNKYNEFLGNKATEIRLMLLKQHSYGSTYPYTESFTKNGQYNFYKEVYDLLIQRYHADFTKLYLKFLDVAHPYIKSRYLKWVYDIVYPNSSPIQKQQLKIEINDQRFQEEGYIPLISIFYCQAISCIKQCERYWKHLLPVFFLVRLFLEPFLLWQLNIFKLDEFFTGDQERGRKYAEVAYLLISIYVQKMIQYDIFLCITEGLYCFKDKQNLILKTQNLTDVSLVRQNMALTIRQDGKEVHQLNLDVIRNKEDISYLPLSYQQAAQLERMNQNNSKMPTMNFMDPNTIASWGIQQKLIWYYGNQQANAFASIFTNYAIGLVVCCVGIGMQYSIQPESYRNKELFQFVLFIYIPMYLLPMFVTITVYFLYCARINYSFVTFNVCLSKLKNLIQSLQRQYYYFEEKLQKQSKTHDGKRRVHFYHSNGLVTPGKRNKKRSLKPMKQSLSMSESTERSALVDRILSPKNQDSTDKKSHSRRKSAKNHIQVAGDYHRADQITQSFHSNNPLQTIMINYLNKIFGEEESKEATTAKKLHLEECIATIDFEISQIKVQQSINQLSFLFKPITFQSMQQVVNYGSWAAVGAAVYLIQRYLGDDLSEEESSR